MGEAGEVYVGTQFKRAIAKYSGHAFCVAGIKGACRKYKPGGEEKYSDNTAHACYFF